MRSAALSLLAVVACTHANRPRSQPSSAAPAIAAAPAITPAPVASAPIATPPAQTTTEPAPRLRGVLDAAPGLATLALFRHDESADNEAMIISGTTDDAGSASCIATATETRCIEFAGYTEQHLADVLRKQKRPSIPVPTWITATLAAAQHAPDITFIATFLGDGGPVLMIGNIDGVHFAIRRDRRWRVTENQYYGGKVATPGYFGSVDLSAATGTPSIGVIISSYVKEGCLRAELVELVVLHVEGDELTDHGSALVGRGAWIATAHSKFGPFDSRDPNHFRVQLRPSVETGGRIRLQLDSKHTPEALRKRREICGIVMDFRAISDVQKLIGVHRLADLLAAHAREDDSEE